ncbi:hypothetical protein J4E93_008632 [Alternaria ventricosa]|uniref:uncharacterized protein n=1 Tax=Alternaria ventricosa TaxID=1187951 RepID=UPI0020C38899|nr:uncharacterized protein J4E93_008632 [Alternaria ventricosa]KAI4640426.1 hypothetical protein J4E93_008632 [Alternaria ventricosa]
MTRTYADRGTRTPAQSPSRTAAMHFPVPDPKRSRIAQASSGSGDPSASSPILTIAPELRNQIYEYLLVDLDPITIDNTTVEYAKIKAAKGTSTSIGSPTVLLTCRQIYHEAVGVLYSRNVFHFQYNMMRERFGVLVTSPIKVCAGWIDNIGSCLPKMRTLTISMNMPEIPEHYAHFEECDVEMYVHDHSREPTDVLPLLDVFWNSDASNTSVIVEVAENDTSDMSESEFEEPRLDTTIIAHVLSELGKKDALDLQKSRRLLEAVYVDTTGNQGTVAYRSTHSKANMRRKFELMTETQRYEIVPLRNPSNLFSLPYNITGTITCLALDDLDFTYNFHTSVTHGHQPGMLWVNSQLRQLVAPWFLRRSRFTLVLGTDSLKSSKAMFDRLDRRIAETLISRPPDWQTQIRCNPISASTLYSNAPTIILQFQTNEPPHLAAVQINAWDLLRVTAVFENSTDVTVRVHGGNGKIQDRTSKLGDIRKDAYILLKHIRTETRVDTRKLSVQVQLNSQCVPMWATLRKTRKGLQPSVTTIVDSWDTEELKSLFDRLDSDRRAKLEESMDEIGICLSPYWPQEDGDSECWENKSMDDVLWRLYNLCG